MAKPDPVPAGPPVAVIDIGATSIRMAIAEIREGGTPRILETLSQTVTIGKDTFTRGSIRRQTIEDCVGVLVRYQKTLHEYGISRNENIRVVATSAVREANNRMSFTDRIYVATGLRVDPIDEAEESRITFLSVFPQLRRERALAESSTLVIEIGGGSTDVLLVDSGNVLFAHTYRLGTLRIRETMTAYQTPGSKLNELLDNWIDPIVKHINEHRRADSPLHLLALGGDIRFAVSQIHIQQAPQSLSRLAAADYHEFVENTLRYDEEELVSQFGLSLPDAETVGIALLAYSKLAQAFDLDHLMVSRTNLRDGLLGELSASDTWAEEFANQIIRSALLMGRRYQFDEDHCRHVAYLCGSLFHQLENEHRLHVRYATLLHVAALLYEVGLFVNSQSYHKHSLYLIRYSEIFGLSKKELVMVGLVARYHRRATPQPRHDLYMSLDREHRTTVSKLAAILRVAVALDQSRSQRIQDLQGQIQSNKMIIIARNCHDVSLEQMALKQSGDLFEDVYGKKILLRGMSGAR